MSLEHFWAAAHFLKAALVRLQKLSPRRVLRRQLALLNSLGFCLLGQGDPQEAEKVFSLTLPYTGDHLADTYHGLGRTCAARGNHDAAEELYMQAVGEIDRKKHPDKLADVAISMAELCVERGQDDEAVGLLLTVWEQGLEDGLAPEHKVMQRCRHQTTKLFTRQNLEVVTAGLMMRYGDMCDASGLERQVD